MFRLDRPTLIDTIKSIFMVDLLGFDKPEIHTRVYDAWANRRWSLSQENNKIFKLIFDHCPLSQESNVHTGSYLLQQFKLSDKDRSVGDQEIVHLLLEILKEPNARQVLSGDTLMRLRSAILTSSEIDALRESLKKERSCAGCARTLVTEEMCTFIPDRIRDGSGGGGFYCVSCYKPTTMICAGCVENTLPFDFEKFRSITDGLCPTCKENKPVTNKKKKASILMDLAGLDPTPQPAAPRVNVRRDPDMTTTAGTPINLRGTPIPNEVARGFVGVDTWGATPFPTPFPTLTQPPPTDVERWLDRDAGIQTHFDEPNDPHHVDNFEDLEDPFEMEDDITHLLENFDNALNDPDDDLDDGDDPENEDIF